MGTARSREHFVGTWQGHVKELATLVLQASSPDTVEAANAKYERFRKELFEMIEDAADQAFPRDQR